MTASRYFHQADQHVGWMFKPSPSRFYRQPQITLFPCLGILQMDDATPANDGIDVSTVTPEGRSASGRYLRQGDIWHPALVAQH